MGKNTTENKSHELKKIIPVFQKLWLQTAQADSSALFPMDMLTTAVTHRSMCLISGFCDLIQKRNFICAAPLIRMQLDSFLRLFAAWLVEDPHDYATKVLSGIKVSNIKDKDGNKLTDNYLAKTLSKQYSWCPRVYEETSGYIHLSKKHFFNTIADVQEKDRSFTTVLGTNDSFLPDEIYVEAVEAMTEISKGIIRYLHGWMHTKSTVNVATHYVEKKVGQKHE